MASVIGQWVQASRFPKEYSDEKSIQLLPRSLLSEPGVAGLGCVFKQRAGSPERLRQSDN
jgi:hypothetical protein